jgi:hypothetical protein
MAAAGATIAGVPALVRFRSSPEAAAGHGTVLYYHGFGGDKGRCEPYLTALAEAGFLAVSLDAVGHGDRRLDDFDVIFDPTLPRAHSPHHHPDRFFPVAVLSQSAELDEYVPAGPVRDFHAALVPWYAQEPGRIEYVEYQGVGHFLTPELNQESCRRLVAWFERWLPGG